MAVLLHSDALSRSWSVEECTDAMSKKYQGGEQIVLRHRSTGLFSPASSLGAMPASPVRATLRPQLGTSARLRHPRARQEEATPMHRRFVLGGLAAMAGGAASHPLDGITTALTSGCGI